MASSLDGGPGHLHESTSHFDPVKHVSPGIAHELNNILTIVQGYADRLLMKYPDDKALQPQLKLISEAARRAAIIIRDATPQNVEAIGHTPPQEPEPAAA
jgi:nitrogen-specific signal transduction histidine kinase